MVRRKSQACCHSHASLLDAGWYGVHLGRPNYAAASITAHTTAHTTAASIVADTTTPYATTAAASITITPTAGDATSDSRGRAAGAASAVASSTAAAWVFSSANCVFVLGRLRDGGTGNVQVEGHPSGPRGRRAIWCLDAVWLFSACKYRRGDASTDQRLVLRGGHSAIDGRRTFRCHTQARVVALRGPRHWHVLEGDGRRVRNGLHVPPMARRCSELASRDARDTPVASRKT